MEVLIFKLSLVLLPCLRRNIILSSILALIKAICIILLFGNPSIGIAQDCNCKFHEEETVSYQIFYVKVTEYLRFMCDTSFTFNEREYYCMLKTYNTIVGIDIYEFESIYSFEDTALINKFIECFDKYHFHKCSQKLEFTIFDYSGSFRLYSEKYDITYRDVSRKPAIDYYIIK